MLHFVNAVAGEFVRMGDLKRKLAMTRVRGKAHERTYLNKTEDDEWDQVRMLGSCLNTEAALVLLDPFPFGFAYSESTSLDDCSSICDDSSSRPEAPLALRDLLVAWAAF